MAIIAWNVAEGAASAASIAWSAHAASVITGLDRRTPGTVRWRFDLLRDLVEGYVFVHRATVSRHDDWSSLIAMPQAREYLGSVLG